jgi:phosphosulfolactate synthase (CoM biosynthesis protein A)
MNEIRISNAIKAINPDALFSCDNNDVDILRWHEGTIPIAKEDILAKQIELQAEYDAKDYARKRETEYPSIQDLVVALYDIEDRTAIDEKRAEIKLKYPKPVA